MPDKALVAYYSVTGNTKRVGDMIAGALGADVEAIRELQPRNLEALEGEDADGQAIMKATREAFLGHTPEILAPERDPSAYDLIVIGSPTWVSSLPGPTRAYLKMLRGTKARLAFFCTRGGMGLRGRVLRQMRRAVGRKPMATCAFEAEEREGEAAAAIVAEFVDRLSGA